VFDEVPAVAAVPSDCVNLEVSGSHLADQVGAGGGIGHARGGDQGRGQQAEGVGDDAPPAAHDPAPCGIGHLGIPLAVSPTGGNRHGVT